jgi:hypothetical protein
MVARDDKAQCGSDGATLIQIALEAAMAVRCCRRGDSSVARSVVIFDAPVSIPAGKGQAHCSHRSCC